MTVIVTFPSKHPWACVIKLPEIWEDWPMAPAAVAAGAPISLQFCGFSVEGPSLSNPHHGGVAILCWGLNRKRGGTHRWTQPPLSCWPQRPTHLASLVGGTRRGRGLRLELVSAGGRDTEL